MRTECVTKVWEFYRDNCDGFKEPMRKQLRELDEHVDQIAAENAKLRDGYSSMSREHSQTIVELSDAHYCIDELKAENAKLRELLRAAYNCTNAGPSCLECRVVAGGCTLLSAMHELGVVE